MTDPHSTRISRVTAAIADIAWWVGVFSVFGSFLFPNSRWGILTHLGIPLLFYPLYSYVFARFLGATPAELLVGLKRTLPDGRNPQRLYDWLFQSKPRFISAPRPLPVLLVFAFATLVFAFGGSTLLWLRDPTIRPFTVKKVPVFAPEAKEAADWNALPYFYATGAFPTPNQLALRSLGGLEYSLPYERGPPTRFLGKILVYWRRLDARLILTGPATAASPSSPEELQACVTRWFGCVSARRKIWKTSIGAYFDDRTIAESSWFEVDNGFIAAEERARGLYVRSSPENGRIREAYFVVGPKMAIQGFILDRPDTGTGAIEGKTASELLGKIVGSLRMSGDLMAPRAFVNPKLASLRVGPKSTLQDLIAAEAVLLAKVSIEPKESESFYHLAGLAITLFRAAKAQGQIELAATSKVVVSHSLRYIRDVDPLSKRIPEMEGFEAEVEAN